VEKEISVDCRDPGRRFDQYAVPQVLLDEEKSAGQGSKDMTIDEVLQLNPDSAV
jgi:hypothetical protein